MYETVARYRSREEADSAAVGMRGVAERCLAAIRERENAERRIGAALMGLCANL